MKDFSNAFGSVELPQQSSGANYTPRESNVDWDVFAAKQLEVIGGEGKHSGKIGVITNAYDLGLQNQDEQTIPIDSQDFENHKWRLERHEDSGIQKDATAKVEMRWYKKKQQECLVYTPQPIKQFALAVDFPEIMFPYGEFYEGSSTKPLRVILGKEGFITKGKADLAGTRNLIAKPFSLKHVNVNRGKEGVEVYFALAKNGKVVKIAHLADVLDANGNFHAQDVGKLIGKAVMCDLTVEVQKWNDKTTGAEKSKVVIDAEVVAKLGPRDVPYFESELKPLLTDDLFGFVLFKGVNDDDTLKTLNAAVINTMKLSPEFEGSDLAKQLEKVKGSTTQQKPQQKAPVSNGEQSSGQGSVVGQVSGGHASSVQQSGSVEGYNQLPMDFDDK